MNSLYNSGVRQTNSIQADLDRLRNGDASASLIGQISASLDAMQRTVDDYDSMAKREIIKTKQEKALMRVQKFRTDYSEMKTQFKKLTNEVQAEKDASNRAELIPQSASASSDARRRFQTSPPTSTLHPGLRPSEEYSESPFHPSTPQYNRENHLLNEHTFVQNANERLDEFLLQGREVLDNLVDQRTMLKGTKKRLLDAANTIGLSRDVIGWIEKRSTQDTYIFFGGAVFTFICFFFIWKYLG